jgi:hypothetical protein
VPATIIYTKFQRTNQVKNASLRSVNLTKPLFIGLDFPFSVFKFLVRLFGNVPEFSAQQFLDRCNSFEITDLPFVLKFRDYFK